MNNEQTLVAESVTHEEENKGNKLEQEFAEFMRTKLGWNNVRVGAHLKGKENVHGAKVDIISECLDYRGKLYKTISLSLMGVSSALLIATMFNNFFWIASLMMSSLALTFGTWFYASRIKLSRTNALVECKNLKGKSNINHIAKTVRELEDYKKSGDKRYNFVFHVFVSANGYVENALRYAQEHKIVCYEKKNDEFVVTEYWK